MIISSCRERLILLKECGERDFIIIYDHILSCA